MRCRSSRIFKQESTNDSHFQRDNQVFPGLTTARPDHGVAMGGQIPVFVAGQLCRIGPIPDEPHPLPARHHGLLERSRLAPQNCLRKGRADRRNRGRQQLRRLCYAHRAGAHHVRTADRQNGRTVVQGTHRPADRELPRTEAARGSGQEPRQQQHDHAKEFSRRSAADGRRQQRSGVTVCPYPEFDFGRGGRLPAGLGRRGIADRLGDRPYSNLSKP